MATFFLINLITVNTSAGMHTLLPGSTIDDAKTDTASILAAGGELVATSDATVAAGAAEAASARARGANEAALESIMRAAVSKSASAAQTAHDAIVAAATGATVNAAATGLTVNRSGVPVQETFAPTSLPAKGVAVHAQVAAGAPLNVLAAFTLPLPRRSLEVVLGVGGAACVVTITGTAPDGSALVKTATFAAAGTQDVGNGADCFETIASMTSDVNPGGTVDLKTGDGFAVAQPYSSLDVLSVDGVVQAAAATSPTTGGVKPTTVPDGAKAFTARYTLVHGHAVTDPTHAHGVTDPTHTHAMS